MAPPFATRCGRASIALLRVLCDDGVTTTITTTANNRNTATIIVRLLCARMAMAECILQAHTHNLNTQTRRACARARAPIASTYDILYAQKCKLCNTRFVVWRLCYDLCVYVAL